MYVVYAIMGTTMSTANANADADGDAIRTQRYLTWNATAIVPYHTDHKLLSVYGSWYAFASAAVVVVVAVAAQMDDDDVGSL